MSRRLQRAVRRVGACLVVMLAFVGGAPAVRTAHAHPLDPSLLELRESGDGDVDVLFRTPLGRIGDLSRPELAPLLPASCRALDTPELHQAGGTATLRWRIHCDPAGLANTRVGVRGLDSRGTDALLRIRLADGRVIQSVLRADAPVVTVPDGSGVLQVVGAYLGLGFEHILGGLDHLVFVLGLVLLIGAGRRLLWTLTAFTLGHSVTLSLAALGFVHVPQAPVEALIAASIFVLALELTREPKAGRRHPGSWAFAGGFGLLHGLGFAGALAEVGLPAEEIPLALFSFNLGIEIGQLCFVAAILAARFALGAIPIRWPRSLAQAPAYAIGTLGAFWVLERLATLR